MTSPIINVSLVDPGAVGIAADIRQKPIYAGVCSQGDNYTVQTFARPNDVTDTLGTGHLVDVLLAALASGAREVKAARLPVSAAGTIDIDESSPEELIIDSISGTPLHFLDGRVECTNGDGATAISSGALKIRYSLDDWGVPNVDRTWSQEVTVPAGGSVVLAEVGLTLNFDTAQTPALDAVAEFTVEPGHYSVTELGTSWTDALKSPVAGEYTYICYTGEPATASGANTLVGTMDSILNTFFSEGRIIGALCGSGLETDADVITAFGSTDADPPFISVGFGAAYRTNPRPTQGRGRIALREHEVASFRIAKSHVSTDPGRTASGSLRSVVGTDYDAALEGDALHDARIACLRTWEPHSRGLFIQRQRMLAPVDSNFRSWQHAAVMIVALRAAHRIAFQLVLEIFRRTSSGTIDPKDAEDIEKATEAEIDRVLSTPLNVRGQNGHISARSVTVDQSVLLPQIRADVRIRPLGYGEDIEFTLQYADEVA